jgi:hypothetical protein
VTQFEFGYDSQGRRIWKKSFGWVNNAWALGEHLVFAYDGWNLLAEFKVVGNQQQLYRSYAWGENLGGGVGGLLSITTTSPAAVPRPITPSTTATATSWASRTAVAPSSPSTSGLVRTSAEHLG